MSTPAHTSAPVAPAHTPEPPYYAVIFTSTRTPVDAGYGDVAQRMVELASARDGFLGVDSARDANGLGITVSYWRDPEAIRAWKADFEHREAQRRGHTEWYSAFEVRIAKVERAYGSPPPAKDVT